MQLHCKPIVSLGPTVGTVIISKSNVRRTIISKYRAPNGEKRDLDLIKQRLRASRRLVVVITFRRRHRATRESSSYKSAYWEVCKTYDKHHINDKIKSIKQQRETLNHNNTVVNKLQTFPANFRPSILLDDRFENFTELHPRLAVYWAIKKIT